MQTVTLCQVSGAAEPGASVVDTAIRELAEEVNVEVAAFHHFSLQETFTNILSKIDLAAYAPRYLGGHHQPRSRDAHFNDNSVCIALRARSTAFAPDMHEVHAAKWASSPKPFFMNRIQLHHVFSRFQSLTWRR
jgi:8-oxo-dGTP pyrophosphatase MutT (NUDIX family)